MKFFAVAVGILCVIALGFFFYAARTDSVVVAETIFDAPVEKVWQVWTEPASIQKWWGPNHYSAPVIQNDLRVGATFLYSMKSTKDHTTWNTGRYTEIILHKKIVSKMSFSDETGTPISAEQAGLPGRWRDEVTVIVTFTPQGQRTHVEVQEEGIPLLMSLFAKMGWEQQFVKLEKLL
jgi:uncharacterized protein YndB with AHSA1/START domain